MSERGERCRNKILAMLAPGDFVSGEQMGQALGVSRVAVAKHITRLIELGLDIQRVTGRGYRLQGVDELLNVNALNDASNTPVTFDLHSVVGSTNDVVKQQLGNIPKGYCCVAEAQLSGRGRQGKRWVSPFGASIYLSMYWPFLNGFQSLNGLSLAVGVAIAEAISDEGGHGIAVKWPNDVYAENNKLAGVLIELEGQVGGQCDAIIGVGINLKLRQPEGIDQPWTDVFQVLGRVPSRNAFCAKVADNLHSVLCEFERHGFAALLSRWQAFDYLAGQTIQVSAGKDTIVGRAKGVNAQGALVVETSQGERAFYGGEISVRRQA